MRISKKFFKFLEYKALEGKFSLQELIKIFPMRYYIGKVLYKFFRPFYNITGGKFSWSLGHQIHLANLDGYFEIRIMEGGIHVRRTKKFYDLINKD